MSSSRKPLVTRPEELERITSALAAPGLVTLGGAAGVGKTTLAVAAMEHSELSVLTPHWFCDLGHAVDGADADAAVAAATGIHPDELHPARDAVGAALAAYGPALLVIDNAEHVAAALADRLVDWLDAAPELRVLVTSREALHLGAERRLEVGPLTAPQAVRLFELRCQAVGATLSLDDATTRKQVEQIVARLDHLPLAIELLAARANVLSPAAMLARLDRDLIGALGRGPRDTPLRHRSLDAAFASSWKLLDPVERHAFAQLALFRGGFDADAFEAVVEVPDGDDALEILQRLRDKSLVAQAPGERGVRLTVWASLREMAQRALEAGGGADAAWRRHADHYIRRGLERRLALLGPDQAAALTWLRRENPNLAAVRRRAVGVDPPRAALATMIASEVALGRGNYGAHAAALREVLDAPLPPVLAAQLLAELGLTEHLAGRPEAALAALDQADAQAAPPVARARWLVCRANVTRTLGRAEEGDACFSEALAIVERLGAPGAVATVLTFQGHHRWLTGDVTGAEASLSVAERLHAHHPNPRNQARTSAYLGLIRLEQGEAEEARRHLDRARALHEDQGDHAPTARVAVAQALVALWQLEPRVAREAAEEAVHVATAAGAGWAESVARCVLRIALALTRARPSLEPPLAALGAPPEPLGDPFYVRARDLADAVAEDRSPLLAPHTGADSGTHLPIRLLDTLAERIAAGRSELVPPPALIVGPGVAWFARAGQDRVSLARRDALRRILAALVAAHAARPPRQLDRDALQAAGWPGERLTGDSGARRVHTAVWTLRRLGLSEVLTTEDGAYALAADLAVTRAADP